MDDSKRSYVNRVVRAMCRGTGRKYSYRAIRGMLVLARYRVRRHGY